MLTVHSLSKSFGIELILKDVSFNLNAGERLGLVGPNGCGKTTLLRILAGLDKPDLGGLHYDPPTLQPGYLAQGFTYTAEETVGSFLARMEGDLPGLTGRLEQLAALMTASNRPDLQSEYDTVLAVIETVSQSVGRAPGVLVNLGLELVPLDLPTAKLSGGQKTRLALAGILLSNPQLLLLDEPTNHLDIAMLEWLEDWLSNYRGAALIVSHDRAFLDNVSTGILELDPQTHMLRQYPGNYSEYVEQKAAERERHWQEYYDQQEEIFRLKAAASHLRGIAKFRRGGKADSGDKFAKGFFANRGKGTVGRAKHIERRLDQMMTRDRIEKPKLTWEMKVEFGDLPVSGRDVLVMEDLSIGYNDLVLLEHINQTIRLGERVALIGPNGSGKTTLLRTITASIPPLDGNFRLGSNVRLGYMAQEQEDLDPRLDALTTISRLSALNETEARAFLSKYLFKGDDVFVPVENLSFGERVRLTLACFVARGCNFLLLDEPINHLDIPSRARFEQAIAHFDGTVLAVVHDRYFIEGFASVIWEVDNRSLRRREKEPV